MPAGSFRTRVISYSGYGPTDFPLIEVPAAFAGQHPEWKGRLWDEIDGARVLLAPFSRTMAVNGAFDLAAIPIRRRRRNSAITTLTTRKMLVDTSEEWVLYNCSISLWSHTDTRLQAARPVRAALPSIRSPGGGQARFARDPEFQITTKGADHPFHIHVNPFG